MIAKIIMNNSIASLLNYLKNKNHEVVTAKGILPMVSNEQIVKSFERIQGLNTRARHKTIHLVLSFPKSDIIGVNNLNNIIHDFIDDFSKDNEMWIAIQHPDTEEHQHVHIALNRVLSNGKLISDSNSAYKAKDICRKLEKKYRLEIVSNIKNKKSNKRLKSLKAKVDIQIKKSKTLENFQKGMFKNGYKVLIARGITFIDKENGMKIKGSDLGRQYSLQGISKQLKVLNHSNTSDQPLKNNLQRGKGENLLINILEVFGDALEVDQVPTEQMDVEELKKKKKRKKIKR